MLPITSCTLGELVVCRGVLEGEALTGSPGKGTWACIGALTGPVPLPHSHLAWGSHLSETARTHFMKGKRHELVLHLGLQSLVLCGSGGFVSVVYIYLF